MTINKQALREKIARKRELSDCRTVIDVDVLAALLDGLEGADRRCEEMTNYRDNTVKKVVRLRTELTAAENRIAELTGKPASEYEDDADLLFEIDFCDDPSTSIQVAQWLKELRIRRAAGIITKVGE